MSQNFYNTFAKNTDTAYSYAFAKRMEENKCNPKLGYRTAGSDAELATAGMIADEMRAIGLTSVTKDAITVDGWEFTKADMHFTSSDGSVHDFVLGSYQTNFDTEGSKTFEVVYVGKGTAKDYEGRDVTDKLVLADIDQRNEWWSSYPVYQAYLRGAAALIAVQFGGYGEIDDAALNAQDIAGPDYAPAFSISRRDAAILKREIAVNGSATVEFDAKSEVWRGATAYNVWGELEGEDNESALLLSAHYDSYFTGFQDDNAAVAMMLSIARSLIGMHYKPRKTIRFCAFAAEEWGVVNSKYDWSCGAYAQLFKKRTGWRGTVYAALNFELPACRHGDTDAIHCSYEYNSFYNRALSRIPLDKSVFPGGVRIVSPVETWSDDFTLSVSGIPAAVNDFSNTEFMTTTYHSQFDNDANYAEDVYRFHHVLYGGLTIALDCCTVAPIDFSARFRALKESLGLHGNTARLRALAERAGNLSAYLSKEITRINAKRKGRTHNKPLEQKMLAVFAACEDAFVRLNWQDDVRFPHEIIEENLGCMEAAVRAFRAKKPRAALRNMYSIDNNRYAFEFDKSVFTYFTQYVLEQPVARLQWGAGRVIGHESLFELIEQTQEKVNTGKTGFSRLEKEAEVILRRMEHLLNRIIAEEEQATERILADLESITQTIRQNRAHRSVRKAGNPQKSMKKTHKTAVGKKKRSRK